ncbi:HSF-type DNA-binding protein [Nitzschia inconspicua]|uniref:HSF-type DNA-binding protein n=1 Tax=Nitzschia inconspicua TaxID=303405 RepID=A0A9K3KSG2_9STRA|nr:HSF-type DNA-binding protein [Nitzschia inconspicua]
MDSSEPTSTTDDSMHRMGRIQVPDDDGDEADQLIEPLPAYGIEYYSFQQQQQSANGNETLDSNPTRGLQDEVAGQDPDVYQPLPINPPLPRMMQNGRPGPENVFAFEEDRQVDGNEPPSTFYFPDGTPLPQNSVREHQEENVHTPPRREYLYEDDGRRRDQTYRLQNPETNGRNRRLLPQPDQPLQQAMIEPNMLEAQTPQQTLEEGFDEAIDPQPWPPRPSPLPVPQQEPATWWDSNHDQQRERILARDPNHRNSVALPSPQQQRQVTDPIQEMERAGVLQQQLFPLRQGKGLRTQHDIAFHVHQQCEQIQGSRFPANTGEVSVTGDSYRSLQRFQKQLYFTQPQPNFQCNTAVSPLPQSGAMTNDSLEHRQKQENEFPIQSAPKVTVGTIHKSRKSKEPETTADNYILRIHDMLEEAQSKKFCDVISWQNHGRAFKIHQPERFYSEILPKYFHCKQSSFLRWLRAWGFVRIIEGPDRGAYFHRYFVRGVTSLIKNKTRNQMHEAMESWPKAGNVALSLQQDAVTNGRYIPKVMTHNESKKDTGEALVKPSKDPKLLRGKILHEVREMLRMAEVEHFTDIVGWCKSGTSFRIYKRGPFQEKIMSKYLSCAKLTYLSDMLRIWGFCRLKHAKGDEKNAYYHRLFQRDKPALCRNLSKEEMYDSMKEVREEQKRLQETSWSLIVADVDMNDENQRFQKPNMNAATADSRALDIRLASNEVNVDDSTSRASNSMPLLHQIPFQAKGGEGMIATENDAPNVFLHGLNSSSTMNHYGPAVFYERGGISTNVGKPSAVDQEELSKDISILWNIASKSKTTYVVSIHNMLEDAESKGFIDVVSWIPHGRCFKVHNEKRFEADVLPNYFNAKLPSFYRWLRAWGFTRLLAGKDRGCWYHRFFVRGVTDLVKDLSRQDMFDAMDNWVEPGKEPDFHRSGSGDVLSEKLLQKKDLVPGTNLGKVSNIHEKSEESRGNDTKAAEGDVIQSDPKILRGRVPEDIRDMLDQAKAEKAENVVSWLVHGKAFAIHNRPEFMTRFMPRFFKSKKFEYFTDVIRNWGFVRLKQSKDKGAYYHKLFERDNPRATLHLSRKQMKESMANWRTPDDKEPNLYEGISEDVLRASEQMQALRSGKKRTTRIRGKHAAVKPRKKPRLDAKE